MRQGLPHPKLAESVTPVLPSNSLTPPAHLRFVMLLPLLGACAVVGPFQGPEWEPVRGLLSEDRSCRDPRCCGNLLVLCLFLIWQVQHYWHQVTRTHPSTRKVIKVRGPHTPPSLGTKIVSFTCYEDPVLCPIPEINHKEELKTGHGEHYQTPKPTSHPGLFPSFHTFSPSTSPMGSTCKPHLKSDHF